MNGRGNVWLKWLIEQVGGGGQCGILVHVVTLYGGFPIPWAVGMVLLNSLVFFCQDSDFFLSLLECWPPHILTTCKSNLFAHTKTTFTHTLWAVSQSLCATCSLNTEHKTVIANSPQNQQTNNKLHKASSVSYKLTGWMLLLKYSSTYEKWDWKCTKMPTLIIERWKWQVNQQPARWPTYGSRGCLASGRYPVLAD